MPTFLARVKKSLSVKFEDEKMEAEYFTLKMQNSLLDFQAAACLMIIISIFGFAFHIKNQKWILASLSVFSILFNFGIIIFHRKQKQYQRLLLLALLYFSFLCLAYLLVEFEKENKVTIVFITSLYTSSQFVVLSRIQNQYIKLLIMFVVLVLKCWLLTRFEPDTFFLFSWFKHVFSDLFIISISFSNERTDRRVFQTYYENQDELKKFKELLAYSLPQSVTVVDFQTHKQLFANNTFLDSFDTTEDVQLSNTPTDSLLRPHLNMLKIDSSTLREIGNPQRGEGIFNQLSSCPFTLRELLKCLTKGNLLDGKTLSIHASYEHLGKQWTFQITLKKIKWERTDAIAIVLNDTTEHENFVVLKQSNNNKDQIIATVSHELRTPLHGIIGLLEIVETRAKDEDTINHLSLCKDNAQLLLSLVNSLLDLQQLSTGKLKLNQAKINLTKTLQNVANLFKFQCDQKKISLEVDIQDFVRPCITTDENRLKQILINLIGNAIKFTFQGGIKVEVSQDTEEPDYLMISVKDSGIGIKEHDLGKLFKMYGKLEDCSGVNKNGVGLGLTISNTLVGLLNGQGSKLGIQVESQYGIGSNFSFKILKRLKKNNECLIPNSPLLGEKLQKNDCSFETILDSYHDDHHEKENSLTRSKSCVGNSCTENLTNIDLASKLNSCLWKVRDTPTTRIKKFECDDEAPSFLLLEKDGKDDEVVTRNQRSLRVNFAPPSDSVYRKHIKECILVVDDNPFNILVARSLLKDMDYEVRSASGGKEAIEAVQDCNREGVKIRVIFLDCQMPIMDGYETAKILKSMMENGDVLEVPILAWTANNSEQDIARCYKSGMTGYLSKPTTKENVLKAIPK